MVATLVLDKADLAPVLDSKWPLLCRLAVMARISGDRAGYGAVIAERTPIVRWGGAELVTLAVPESGTTSLISSGNSDFGQD